MTDQACCETWEDAQQPGTDNEGYAELIDQNRDGSFTIGMELPAIRFCPWCGQPKH